MNKIDIQAMLAHHDQAIRQLERSAAQMMIIWKVVGAVALVVLSVWLNSQIGAA